MKEYSCIIYSQNVLYAMLRGRNGFILIHSTVPLNWYPDLSSAFLCMPYCPLHLVLYKTTPLTVRASHICFLNSVKSAQRCTQGLECTAFLYHLQHRCGYRICTETKERIVRDLLWQVRQGLWEVGNKHSFHLTATDFVSTWFISTQIPQALSPEPLSAC